jgi:hypothetical protein
MHRSSSSPFRLAGTATPMATVKYTDGTSLAGTIVRPKKRAYSSPQAR